MNWHTDVDLYILYEQSRAGLERKYRWADYMWYMAMGAALGALFLAGLSICK